MSFLSDLFHGNMGNLGNDLFGSPTAIAETIGAVAAPFALGALAPAALGAIGAGVPLAGEATAAAWGGAGGLGSAVGAAEGAAGAGGALGFAGDAGAGGALSGLTSADVAFGLGDTAAYGLASANPADPSLAAFLANPEAPADTFPSNALAEFSRGQGPTDPALAEGDLTPEQAWKLGYPSNPTTNIAQAGGAGGSGVGAPAVSPLPGYEGSFATPANPNIGGVMGEPGGPAAPAPGFLDKAGGLLKSAAPFAGVAGLGYNFYQGYQQQQQLKALQDQEAAYQKKIEDAGSASLAAAKPMLDAGQALTLGTGPVPGPMQAMLDKTRNGMRARIIQGYASRGQSADPKQNSALAQELNNVDTQMLAMREQIGEQITNTANSMLARGVSATQIAAQMPIMMKELDIRLQQISGNAIANFASAMAGGTSRVAGAGSGGNLNLNLGRAA